VSYLALAAVGLAAALDALVGEVPAAIHPVALLGRVVAIFDREWVAPRFAGSVVALALPLLVAVLAASVVSASAALSPLVPGLVAALVLFVTTSLRLLLGEARAVVALVEDDLATARVRLRSLAGRDASDLSAEEVRSAVIESLAENLADGLVAPLLAFVVLAPVSLAAAAGGAAWVKAVNTLDSMLGYPEKPHGWASARLDDLVMFLPARVSAVLLAVAAGQPDAAWRARKWARAPPSPNSGWPMATLAAALAVRLEKPGVYVLNELGRLPDTRAAERAIAVTRRAGVLAWAVTALFAWRLVPGVVA
jgi:adenosylcobinamide-phosphate synthase